MSSPPDWSSTRARLLDEIENFAVSNSHVDEAMTPSELRALARAPLEINLSEPAPAPVVQPPAAPVATPSVASPPAAATASGGGGLLAQLKRQAEEKLAATTRNVAVEAARLKRIDEGLRAAYRYLDDLAKQLNVIKPQFPADYPLGTLLRIEKPVWHESHADFRRKMGPTEDLPYENVTLRYILRGGSPIVLDKADHLVDTTRKMLGDFGLTFSLEEKRNLKGFVERGRFTIQPEIKAGLIFQADFEKGSLLLRTRNVQRFGSAAYDVPAEAITEQTLEEVALLILGQSSQFIQRFQRTS